MTDSFCGQVALQAGCACCLTHIMPSPESAPSRPSPESVEHDSYLLARDLKVSALSMAFIRDTMLQPDGLNRYDAPLEGTAMSWVSRLAAIEKKAYARGLAAGEKQRDTQVHMKRETRRFLQARIDALELTLSGLIEASQTYRFKDQTGMTSDALHRVEQNARVVLDHWGGIGEQPA